MRSILWFGICVDSLQNFGMYKYLFLTTTFGYLKRRVLFGIIVPLDSSSWHSS